MKPPKSILDKSFVYRSSTHTDISKTWAKAREQLEKDQQERSEKVRTIKQIGKR